jgi:hypothetical protein
MFSDGARIELMKTTTLSPLVIEPGAQRMGPYSYGDLSVFDGTGR